MPTAPPIRSASQFLGARRSPADYETPSLFADRDDSYRTGAQPGLSPKFDHRNRRVELPLNLPHAGFDSRSGRSSTLWHPAEASPVFPATRVISGRTRAILPGISFGPAPDARARQQEETENNRSLLIHTLPPAHRAVCPSSRRLVLRKC